MSTEVLQGTLDLVVLRTLDTMGPQHGFGLANPAGGVSGSRRRARRRVVYGAASTDC